MRQKVFKHKLVLFYLFAFAISWTAWFIMSRVYRGGDPGVATYAFSSLGGLGPLLALSLLEKLTDKRVELRRVLSQIRIRDAQARWFLPAILALPVITLLGNAGYTLLGREASFRLIRSGPDTLGLWVLPIMVIQFAAALITSPLFEEPGWRGFALGHLQARWGREVGSLVVAVLWWVWHQPMNLTFGLQPTVYSFLSMVALSFLIDSLFNLSGQNLFTAMLAHQSSGTVITFLYQGTDNLLTLALLVGLVIALRLRERRMQAPTLQPA